jgi:hypothetical protein
MPKKIQIPFILMDGVTIMDGYDSPCDGLGIINDKDLKTWRLLHIASGAQIGRFRTRAMALRAAELHTEIPIDWTESMQELRDNPERDMIAIASLAACAIVEAEDQAERAEKKREAEKQDTSLS